MQIDYATVYYATGIIFGVVSSIGTFIAMSWKGSNWLNERFTKLYEDLRTLVDEHEERDHMRHVDNIERFAVIETKLETVIKNGKH